MKKILLTGLLGLMLATGHAQSAFSLGITGGLSHAFVSTYDNNKFNPCWNAGIMGIYSPWAHWGVGLDLRYSTEGYQMDFSHGTYSGSTSSDLRYVRIVPKAMYFFRPNTVNFRPKITLGPSVGILVDEINPNGERANSVDVGAQASLGFNLRLVKELWLNVDAAYYQGFLDVYKTPSGGQDLNANMGLNLGLTFGF